MGLGLSSGSGSGSGWFGAGLSESGSGSVVRVRVRGWGSRRRRTELRAELRHHLGPQRAVVVCAQVAQRLQQCRPGLGACACARVGVGVGGDGGVGGCGGGARVVACSEVLRPEQLPLRGRELRRAVVGRRPEAAPHLRWGIEAVRGGGGR